MFYKEILNIFFMKKKRMLVSSNTHLKNWMKNVSFIPQKYIKVNALEDIQNVIKDEKNF